MTSSDWLLLVFLVLAAGALIGAAAMVVLRIRVSPQEQERRRRKHINGIGRPHDGLITDFADGLIHYVYEIHGVSYTASQDVTALAEPVPYEASRIVGPATLKYLVRNPANSIVICENWSGLRIRDPGPEADLCQGESNHEKTV